MKFYAPKYKQLDLGLLRSSLDELDKTNRWVALGDLLPCHPSQVFTEMSQMASKSKSPKGGRSLYREFSNRKYA